jgi:hypothetical protein
MAVTTRAARKITIFCPVEAGTLTDLIAGDLAAIERDPTASRLLAIIRADNPLGDFDIYQGVFELAFGLEGFTATPRAAPTLGSPGNRTLSPTVAITTYVDARADADAVNAALAALVEAHPWELPVIEVSEAIRLASAPPA